MEAEGCRKNNKLFLKQACAVGKWIVYGLTESAEVLNKSEFHHIPKSHKNVTGSRIQDSCQFTRPQIQSVNHPNNTLFSGSLNPKYPPRSWRRVPPLWHPMLLTHYLRNILKLFVAPDQNHRDTMCTAINNDSNKTGKQGFWVVSIKATTREDTHLPKH